MALTETAVPSIETQHAIQNFCVFKGYAVQLGFERGVGSARLEDSEPLFVAALDPIKAVDEAMRGVTHSNHKLLGVMPVKYDEFKDRVMNRVLANEPVSDTTLVFTGLQGLASIVRSEASSPWLDEVCL